MDHAWSKGVDEVFSELGAAPQKGLCAEEVHRRIKANGANVLPKKGGQSWWRLLLRQFSGSIIWLLLGAAVVAGFLGEATDAWAIVAIVILNALLGFFQEFRAENALEVLQQLSPSQAKVIRDGILSTVPSEEIAVGDLLLLEAGDCVPADGRVVDLFCLSTDESLLTGESAAVQKAVDPLQEQTPLAERKSMVFRGTYIATGKGHALVTATGGQTEMGKIACGLLEEKKGQTPLQLRLDHLGKMLVYLCISIVFVVFALGMLRGLKLVDMLLVALSLAVAAVPEGLAAAVTISLSLGARKMAQHRALIRRLASVETLGSTQVICTDKTGTLTQNEMTVRKLYIDGKFLDVTGSGYEPIGAISSTSASLQTALQIAMLCNSANTFEQQGRWVCAGDPTECALLTVGKKGGLDREALKEAFPLVEETPFDSERKMMSVLVQSGEQKCFYVKGAPDILLERSSQMVMEGEVVPLDKKAFERANHALAGDAYRVLGVAYQPDISKGEERDLVFVGLFAMIDPPRPQVRQAIAECKRAGIQILMATGDQRATAEAIAKELGIDASKAVTASELDELSDEEIRQACVFSRITAAHKLRIVNALQKAEAVVAMTGDGINDAPAIKAADIGIAMGVAGTDVTKESADMVILDDNFVSIAQAVKQGRGVYDNIVKFVSYLLSSNIAEIFVIFIPMLVGMAGPDGATLIPLLPVQLLWINLVTDGFPALCLALDPVDPRVMTRPPRPKGEEILNRRFLLFTLSIGLLVTAAALAACLFGLQKSVVHAQTMTFTTLVILELVRAQMVRHQYRLSLLSNPYLIVALASSLLLQLAVIYIPPLSQIFGTIPLGFTDWAVIGGVAFALWWLGLFVTELFYTKSRELPES